MNSSKQQRASELKKKINSQRLTAKAHKQLSELSAKRREQEYPICTMRDVCAEAINEMWERECNEKFI